MLKPLSIDLRRRIVEAKEAGGSLRSVRDRFGVAASSVSNGASSRRSFTQENGCTCREFGQQPPHLVAREGERRAEEDGGDRRSHAIEAHHDWLLELVAETPDLTLAEIRLALLGRSHGFGKGTVWRFFERHRISFKKTGKKGSFYFSASAGAGDTSHEEARRSDR